jgi:hypothetical protein
MDFGLINIVINWIWQIKMSYYYFYKVYFINNPDVIHGNYKNINI